MGIVYVNFGAERIKQVVLGVSNLVLGLLLARCTKECKESTKWCKIRLGPNCTQASESYVMKVMLCKYVQRIFFVISSFNCTLWYLQLECHGFHRLALILLSEAKNEPLCLCHACQKRENSFNRWCNSSGVHHKLFSVIVSSQLLNNTNKLLLKSVCKCACYYYANDLYWQIHTASSRKRKRGDCLE